MKKFKCPYCQKVIGEKPKSTCPFCKKKMRVPVTFLPKEKREKYEERARNIRKHREQKQQEMVEAPISDSIFSRKPLIVMFCIAVLAISGAMLAIKTDKVFNAGRPTLREDKAERQVSVLFVALKNFKKEIGRYPTEEEGLKALVINPGITYWTHPFVSLIKPDPWMQNYVYRLTEETNAIVFSCGKDRLPDTDDDIYPSLSIVNELIEKAPDKERFKE